MFLALYDQAVQQAHYQASLYQSAQIPSAVNIPVPQPGVPQNVAMNYPPTSSQVHPAFPTPCANPPSQNCSCTESSSATRWSN
ncbi:hypothetical protein KIN20_019806 [Parelaphostrongylus tenuis]|uniref:Uncharacterized protein n=1 Tax=Parelaphostrongylus tenuis TaxID=148309 RepID=A0AAD5N5V4_PARTN|nr:hypothetical protein KIN20_019806 [Parelaphostrongylus tenuis]